MTQRTVTVLWALAAAIVSPEIALVLLPMGKYQPPVLQLQRGRHIRVGESVSQVTGGPANGNDHFAVFKESVTNTGTVPIYGFTLQARQRTSDLGAFQHPSVSCGVGDVRRAHVFRSLNGPVNGEFCIIARGLIPRYTVTIQLTAGYRTAAQAAASGRAGANLTALSTRQAVAFGAPIPKGYLPASRDKPHTVVH